MTLFSYLLKICHLYKICDWRDGDIDRCVVRLRARGQLLRVRAKCMCDQSALLVPLDVEGPGRRVPVKPSTVGEHPCILLFRLIIPDIQYSLIIISTLFVVWSIWQQTALKTIHTWNHWRLKTDPHRCLDVIEQARGGQRVPSYGSSTQTYRSHNTLKSK